MKKQSNLSRLLSYAGNYRYFTYASWVLSAAGALLVLVPFWYIWKIISEVLTVMPDFKKAENICIVRAGSKGAGKRMSRLHVPEYCSHVSGRSAL